jgi:hypothetical protein
VNQAHLVLAGVEQRHDVGMMQAGDRLGLRQEAHHLVWPGVGAGEDHLQRDDPAQAQVARLVDDAHAAAAQLLQVLVAGDRRGRGARGCSPGRVGGMAADLRVLAGCIDLALERPVKVKQAPDLAGVLLKARDVLLRLRLFTAPARSMTSA